MSGANPLGGGEAQFCNHCEEPYREVKRLPGLIGFCPTCFEKKMDGKI